ncbi:hypothetical protein [Ferrimonas marina]|uniref:Uncharacterized protein n=1 Tax=Ferrimonas marina TaxID=299255 RepID=A0A1M5Z4A8_9GAMM|nr:hypothetical protein [Ferrimonas marina]SHI18723.1 hypothetical protein SAMN02745129_4566 [Ferrimonas marina]
MESRLLIVMLVMVAGNLYWWYRYRHTEANRNIDGREREEQLAELQDHWVQFTCVAIIIIMVLAPLAHAILQSGLAG